jgi:hypothetical protein
MLETVNLGGFEIETNCPFVGLMVDPGDFQDIGEGRKRWECEERTNETEISCELCMMSAMVSLLNDVKAGISTLIQIARNPGSIMAIPRIETRKK